MAGPDSLCSKAPRGADSRYTTDRLRSAASRAAALSGLLSSATNGRRWTTVTGRRTSTRPRIIPGRPGAALIDGRLTTKDTKNTNETNVKILSGLRVLRVLFFIQNQNSSCAAARL